MCFPFRKKACRVALFRFDIKRHLCVSVFGDCKQWIRLAQILRLAGLPADLDWRIIVTDKSKVDQVKEHTNNTPPPPLALANPLNSGMFSQAIFPLVFEKTKGDVIGNMAP